MNAMPLDAPITSETDSSVVTLLRIEERLARIERALDRAGQAAPEVLGTALDVFDDVERQLRERGIDLDARSRTLLSLLERLTNARTSAALLKLLEVAEQLPHAVATITDTLDQRLAQLSDSGVDLGERVSALLKVVERLTTPDALGLADTLVTHLPALQRLLDSELLSSGAVQTVSKAGSALATAAHHPPASVGAFALLRALRDPDVQRSLGFALTFARLFGRALEPAEHLLPSQTAR